MRENPHVEICAVVGKEFLRYYGTAVFEKDGVIAEKVLQAAPSMRKIYNEETGYRLAIFHLEDASAEFRGMLGVREAYSFSEMQQ